MNILAINAGSSSLKFKIINIKNENVIISGNVCKIGEKESSLSFKVLGFPIKIIKDKISNHKEAVQKIAEILTNKKISIDDISAIGHRIVHGGSVFKNSVLVDDNIIRKIEELSYLAPLHNKTQIETLKTCREVFGRQKKEIVVFDTAFHSTIEPHVYIYAIPYIYYKKYGIRKYGFHGISHKFVSEKYAQIVNKDLKNIKIIICHLGNGSSISAIKNSKVIDTSMGFTPLDGLIMGTRCGSIDPSIITFLQKKEKISHKKIEKILNEDSGFLGISGFSSDVETIKKSKNKRSSLALNMLKHQVVKLIGSYLAALNGCDAIIFTAGIGENCSFFREEVLNNFSYLGVKIDKELNKKTIYGKQGKISTKDSSLDVYVIPTNEELIIARESAYVLKLATTLAQK